MWIFLLPFHKLVLHTHTCPMSKPIYFQFALHECWIWLVKVAQSCPTLFDVMVPARHLCPWNPPGKNTRVGSLSLLQGIFPTQGLNPGLPHCRWILYQLSHQGSPRILEWVAYPFSSGSSWPRNQTGVSCIAGEFFTSWATREAHCVSYIMYISHSKKNLT